ncbi:unnamed protein product [Mytilus coruscus]|uniref:Uncharacterized protein n=1 Tax=Mytilus coruscus TaxID=42192 RepID=A0A6J8ABW7_MYTCO|nr:unnamed protein product [Mytilus coruscus]
MANTKITKRKETKGKFTSRSNVISAQKQFVAFQHSDVIIKKFIAPYLPCLNASTVICIATFTRKSNAITHLKTNHPEKAIEDYISFKHEPREMAKPMHKWRPPFEALQKKNWNGRTPTFKIVPGNNSSYDNQRPSTSVLQRSPINILEQDLHFSESDTSCTDTTQSTPKYITNEYCYVMDLTEDIFIDLATSSSNQIICLDELPEQLWDRHVFVHSIYNIFSK